MQQRTIRSQRALARADPGLAELTLGIVPEYDPWLLLPPDAYFDPAAAHFAIDWIERWCKHVKGPIARQPFILAPFQRALVAMLFGFRDGAGGRRYREVLLYVGKKNAKTSFAAAILLLVMCTDGAQGAEIYSLASAQKQAAYVFDHVSGMVRQEPTLHRRLRILGDKGGTVQKSLVDYQSMSSYKCLAQGADAVDGAFPTLAVIDEVHRHRTGESIDVLVRGARAQKQWLVIYLTTADYARKSVCNDLRARALAVRKNPGDPARPGFDPYFLPAIWEASQDDDWESEETWRKANPGLGIIKPVEALRAAALEAKASPSKLTSFLRLDLNVVVNADEGAFDMLLWDKCAHLADGETSEQWRERMIRVLAGRRCYLSLDMASTQDLASLVAWFPDERVILPWFWCPGDTAADRERTHRAPYMTWARQGFLELTDGNRTDYSKVLTTVNQVKGMFETVELAYDEWRADHLMQLAERENISLNVVTVKQTLRDLNPGTCELERLIAGGEIQHGGNPVLRWNAENTVFYTDGPDNKKPSKKKSTDKIDGIVCLVMALSRAITAPVGMSLDQLYRTDTSLAVDL